MNFMDFFTEEIEYPTDVALNPLPIGTHYSYISSTFLDGFINYVTIIKAFVLGRYYRWDEEINHTISIMNPPGSNLWIKRKCITKDDLYRELTKEKATLHANLDSAFQDDVIILAKAGDIEDEGTCYIFFWYDRDCSDSCIGRFVTKVHESEVVKSFAEYVESELKERGYNTHGAREIPLHYFGDGWVQS
jgi:hypothetical protein